MIVDAGQSEVTVAIDWQLAIRTIFAEIKHAGVAVPYRVGGVTADEIITVVTLVL